MTSAQLSPKQEHVLRSLLEGQSISDAAESASVSRGTVHRWLKDPDFKAALNGARRELRNAHEERLRASVTRALVSVRYQLRISEPKTANGSRTVALDAGTVQTLREHRRRQAEEKLRAGSAYDDQGLVFANELGEYVHPDGFSKRFKRLQAAAGVPVIRFHELRHTHATLALQAGVHPRVVSERLGHSTVTLTLDTYSHVLPAMQEDAAERVARLLVAGDGESSSG